MESKREREVVRIRYALRELARTGDRTGATALITWLERLGEEDAITRPTIRGEVARWRSVFG